MITRGVRGQPGSLAAGQVHLPREIAEAFIQAVNNFYPMQNNGSLKGAMEIVINDFLEIPVILSPDDLDNLMKNYKTKSICEALAKAGEDALKLNESHA